MKTRWNSFSAAAYTCGLVAFFCLLFSFPQAAQAQRLSTNVVPSHYTLAFTPDLKSATFTGSESIDVSIKEPTKSITLNAIEIKFQSVEVQ